MFIIAFYRKNGIYETERKFNIGNSVVYKWERILIEQGKHELGLEKRGRCPNDATVNNVNEDPDLLKEVQSSGYKRHCHCSAYFIINY